MKTPTKNDMWLMLLSTVREAMGRRTYMSELAGELVIKYQDWLTSRELDQIAKEIEENIERHVVDGKRLGQEVDHEAWKNAALKIRRAARNVKQRNFESYR